METYMATHQGECFCGAVKIEVTGDPQAMGYCHCRSCRSWSGGPVNAFSLWKPEDVKVTAGTEQVATFAKTPMSERQYCKKCGGHLMANHPPLKMVDVFAATIPSLKFVPGVHVNYGETVMPMKDGLTKFNDFPSEFGGSGKPYRSETEARAYEPSPQTTSGHSSDHFGIAASQSVVEGLADTLSKWVPHALKVVEVLGGFGGGSSIPGRQETFAMLISSVPASSRSSRRMASRSQKCPEESPPLIRAGRASPRSGSQ
jgi:hypothetical protein